MCSLNAYTVNVFKEHINGLFCAQNVMLALKTYDFFEILGLEVRAQNPLFIHESPPTSLEMMWYPLCSWHEVCNQMKPHNSGSLPETCDTSSGAPVCWGSRPRYMRRICDGAPTSLLGISGVRHRDWNKMIRDNDKCYKCERREVYRCAVLWMQCVRGYFGGVCTPRLN